MTLSQVMRCNLIVACVISAINLLLNGGIAYEGFNLVDSYDSYGSTISNGTGNFNSTSEWFTTISAEYEVLSDFDKEYVYCDVNAILEDPETVGDEFGRDLYALCAWTIVMGVCLLAISGSHCFARCDKFHGVDMADIGPDPEDPRKAVVLSSHKPKTPAEKAAEDLSNFRYNSVVLFFLTGPCIAIFWLLIELRSGVSGMDCQGRFYECGTSGDCTMDDMMTTVALNSSMVKIIISYPLLASGWFFGVFSLLYIMVQGIWLSIGTRNIRYVDVPLFWSLYSMLPFLWVFFLDDKVPIEGIYGIFFFSVAPPLLWSLFMCCYCCNDVRKYDLKTGQLKK